MSRSDEPSDHDPPSGPKHGRLSITLSGCPDGMPREIRRAARRALHSEGFASGHLEVAVIGETEMRRQHARWLGRDAATDVLAFDLRDEPRVGQVDGQLLVSRSAARRRARARQGDWRGELLLYIVHGCLHLCGHDDAAPEAAALMHRREDEILTSLGWGPVYTGGRTARPSGVRGSHRPGGTRRGHS